MTSRTNALGRRVIGALKNESVVVVTSHSSEIAVVLTDSKGKAFASFKISGDGYRLYTDSDSAYFSSFETLISAVKGLATYPKAPKRQQRMTVKTHGAPKYVGISMGSFKPGNLSLDF